MNRNIILNMDKESFITETIFDKDNFEENLVF